MKLSQRLFELIATYMSRPGHIYEARYESDFVMSGLRAANSANMIVRQKILSDVSDVLNCDPRDLEFLFGEYAKSNLSPASYEVMVPDFQSQLMAAAE